MFHNQHPHMDPPPKEGEDRLRYKKIDCSPTCKGVKDEGQRPGNSHHEYTPKSSGVNSAQEQRVEHDHCGAIRDRSRNCRPSNSPHERCRKAREKHQTHSQPEQKENEPGIETTKETRDTEEVKEKLPISEESDDTAGANGPHVYCCSHFPDYDTSDAETDVPLELLVQSTLENEGSTLIEKKVVSDRKEQPNLMLLILPIYPEAPRDTKKEESNKVQNGGVDDKSNTSKIHSGSISSSLRNESTQTSAEMLRRQSHTPEESMAGGWRNEPELTRSLSRRKSSGSDGSSVTDRRVSSTTALQNAIDYSSASLDDLARKQKTRPYMSRQRSTYDFGKILGSNNKWAIAMDAFQKSLIENEKKQESISIASNRRESDNKKEEFRSRITSREFEALLSGRGSFVQDTYTSLHLQSNTSSHRDSKSSHRDSNSSQRNAGPSDTQVRHSSLGTVPENTLHPFPPGPPALSQICSSGVLCNVKAWKFRDCIKQSQRKIPFCKEMDRPSSRDMTDFQYLDDYPVTTERTVPCPLQVRQCQDPNSYGSRTSKRKPSIPTIMEHTDVEPTPPPQTPPTPPPKKSVPQKKQASKARPRPAKPPPKKSPPPPSIFMYGREYKLVDKEPQSSSDVAPSSASTSQSIQVPSRMNIPECCIKKINSEPCTPEEGGCRSGNDWRDPRNMRYKNPYTRIDPYGFQIPGAYGRPYERYGHQPYYEPGRKSSYDSFGSSY